MLGSGVAMLIAPLGAGAQTASAKDVSPYITISQTPSGAGGDCVPTALAFVNGTLTVFPESDANTFKLTINASAPLCDPIVANAVVYKMPPTDPRWPQTLVESKKFTLDVAGT